MADVLVVGKKISEMDLVSDITGVEKIPTDVAGDKAVTTGQLLTYLDLNGSVQWGKITGDLSDQSDLLNKFNLQTSELQQHASNYNNPHQVTATQIGLGNVNDTSDLDKPVSTATQTALDAISLQTSQDITDINEAIEGIIDSGATLEYEAKYAFNLEYANSIGGYPLNSELIRSDGVRVKSTISGNINDPNTNMTGWDIEDSSKIKYRNGSVGSALSRSLSLADMGYKRQPLGYNTVADAQIYDMQADMEDQSLLINGSIHLSKKYRGIRRNANVLGIRGGRSSKSNGLDFDDQIVGVTNSRGLASYGMNDGVSLFTDATLPKLEDWETVLSATYTENTVSIDTSTYAETLLNMKIGDLIQTMHTTKCWGIVQSIDKTTGLITVDEWATSGTTIVTPSNDVGFSVNLINKVWAVNFNTMIPEDSEGIGGVVAELGLQIKKPSATVKNGIDMVLLKGSTVDGDSAFLARGSDYRWTYGYMSQGSAFNFYSDSGLTQPFAGFAENSNAVVGVKFFNKNTYSMLWSTSTDQSSVAIETSPTIFSPNGSVMRQPKTIHVFHEDGFATPLTTTYIIGTAGITVSLPLKPQHIVGHWYEFILVNTGSHSFTSPDSNINGVSTYTFNNTTPYTKLTVLYDGNSWLMYN